MGKKIVIRFAVASDAQRMIKEGIVGGPLPPGQTWADRTRLWMSEQRVGNRVIIVAEDRKGILGTVQLVFNLPEGYKDPEAANGSDIAMMELLGLRRGVGKAVVERLVEEVYSAARKRGVTTLTFCVSMEQSAALAQVKSWGFQEFRIMPEKRGMLAFLKKSL